MNFQCLLKKYNNIIEYFQVKYINDNNYNNIIDYQSLLIHNNHNNICIKWVYDDYYI